MMNPAASPDSPSLYKEEAPSSSHCRRIPPKSPKLRGTQATAIHSGGQKERKKKKSVASAPAQSFGFPVLVLLVLVASQLAR